MLELRQLLGGFARISRICFVCNLITIQDIHEHKQTRRFFFRHHGTRQSATEQYYCTKSNILTFEVLVSRDPFWMWCGVPQLKESRNMRGRSCVAYQHQFSLLTEGTWFECRGEIRIAWKILSGKPEGKVLGLLGRTYIKIDLKWTDATIQAWFNCSDRDQWRVFVNAIGTLLLSACLFYCSIMKVGGSAFLRLD